MNQRDKTAAMLKLDSLQAARLWVRDGNQHDELERQIAAQELVVLAERDKALREQTGLTA